MEDYEFLGQCTSPELAAATGAAVETWVGAGYRRRLGPNHVILEAPGPSVGGIRTVVAIFNYGHVLVPFSVYVGTNSGMPIEALTSSGFRVRADQLLGFNGTEKLAQTAAGWLRQDRIADLTAFCFEVATAYMAALTLTTDGKGIGNG